MSFVTQANLAPFADTKRVLPTVLGLDLVKRVRPVVNEAVPLLAAGEASSIMSCTNCCHRTKAGW